MTNTPVHVKPARNETTAEKYQRHIRNAVVTIACVAVAFALSAVVAGIVTAVIVHDSTAAASTSCISYYC